jgi:hypothetical protein
VTASGIFAFNCTATDYWRRGPPKRTGAAYRQTTSSAAPLLLRKRPPFCWTAGSADGCVASLEVFDQATGWTTVVVTDQNR